MVLWIFFLFFDHDRSHAVPNQDVIAAKESIKALIQPLLPGKKKALSKIYSSFRIDLCEKHQVNWGDVLLKQTPVTLQYKFKDGCDVQGEISPKILLPFEAKLEIRNLGPYTEVVSQNKISASFESKPILNLEMRSGSLKSKKGDVKFEADYQVRINPMNKANPVEENLGGVIKIKEILGQKVSIKESIKVE